MLRIKLFLEQVRNKLDDCLYAIKRIKLTQTNIAVNKKIMREVKLLSSLNHENVVRYYNSWLENLETEEIRRHESKKVKTLAFSDYDV